MNNNLIGIADNTPETLDEQLFGQFVGKVNVFDCANISKENYLSFSHDDKKKIIKQYYFELKS